MAVGSILAAVAAMALPQGAAGDWTLATLDGETLGGQARVVIAPDGAVTGEGPCNAFDAHLTGEGVTGLAATERQCLWDGGEAAFLGALRAVTKAAVQGDALVLSGPAGSLIFHPTLPGSD